MSQIQGNSSSSSSNDSHASSSPPRTPSLSTDWSSPVAESFDVVDADPKAIVKTATSPRPVFWERYPSYSKQAVQERLNEASIFKLDRLQTSRKFPILPRPNALSEAYGTLEFYSFEGSIWILKVDDGFHVQISLRHAIHREWQPNSSWVLELDFGGLDVAAEGFDLNETINEGLRRFVDKYRFLESAGKQWEELKDAVAAETFNKIMKFRAFTSALSLFFDALALWRQIRQIAYIFLAGTEQILSLVSRQLFGMTRDVVVTELAMTDLFGFCKQDVVGIASVLDWEFHGLHADQWAKEFLESQEVKERLELGGAWYRLSCRTVCNFFARKLAEKIKDLPEHIPEVQIPVVYE
ncbi:hypothetical protein PQX77_012199 [Marasmius sp. AFHP31]|nr:hypothetical protein PQX77_012199 [Marasmius sp. AFHP31]